MRTSVVDSNLDTIVEVNLHFTSSMRHERTAGMKSQSNNHILLSDIQVVTVHDTDLFASYLLMGSNKQFQKIIVHTLHNTHLPHGHDFFLKPSTSLEISLISTLNTGIYNPFCGGGEGKMKIFGVNATNNTVQCICCR